MSNDTAIRSLKEKIDDLNQQAWDARVHDSRKAFELSQESVKLARTINYSKGLAEGLRSLGFCYVRLYKNEEAAHLLKESFSLFESLNDLKGQAIVYEYLGIIERNWGNLGASLELLLKGYALIQQTGPIEVEITCCYQIGVTYKHLGNHENALDYLYKALSLSKDEEFILMEGYAINIIGSIYFDNGDYNHALDCYQQGLVIRQQSGDKWGEAGSLDNIGITYLKLNDFDRAISYCKQSLVISQDTGDKKGEANALLHLAEIYQQTNDIGQASKFSYESLEIRKARGDKRGEAEVLLFLADLHKAQPEYDNNVFEWLDNSLKIAEEIKAVDLLSKTRFHLHEYYKQKGDFEEALKNLHQHTNLEKESHKNSINQKVSNLEISHKAETISRRNKELTELNEQIEKANAELKIEAALERVRARTMAMQKSDELKDAANLMFQQLQILGIPVMSCGYNIWEKEEKICTAWMSSEGLIQPSFEIPLTERPLFKRFYESRQKGEPFFVWEEGGEALDEHYKYMLTLPGFAKRIDNFIRSGFSLPTFQIIHVVNFSHGNLTFITHQQIPGVLDLFKRFAKVFEQTYTRFLDLQKAEQQAREAKIEAALERTRTQSMIMQHSQELDDVLRVFHQQVLLLGINSAFSFLWLPDEKNDRHIFWATWGEGQNGSTVFKSKAINYPLDRNEPATAQCLVDWKSNEPVYSYHVPPAGVEDYFAVWQELIDGVEQLRPEYFSGGLHYVEAFMKYGCFGVMVAFDLTEDEKKILGRFAKEFERTYTRFLDLQKAEAQAREAQIEAGLERVRSRSLAMHNTSELQEVIHTVHKELLNLNIAIHGGSFITINRDIDKVLRCWGSGGTADTSEEVCLPLYEKPFCTNLINRIKNGPGFFTEEYTQQEKKDFFTFLFEYEPWSKLDAEQKNETLSSPGGYTRSCCVSQHTSIFIINHLGEKFSAADNDILQRFAKVFEQSYARFLDLQKAEAQAREAKIQLALERVRARTMAMQKSDELPETSHILFEQMKELGEPVEQLTIGIVNEENSVIEISATLLGDTLKKIYCHSIDEPYMMAKIYKAWKKQQKTLVVELRGDELNAYNQYRNELTNSKMFPTNLGKEHQRIVYAAFFSKGMLALGANETRPPESLQLLVKFASVFDLTYTRFLDLQKAEAQAREAQIETALERVRSRTMGMQKSEELKEVIQVVYEQFVYLNIKVEHSGFVMDYKARDDYNIWVADPLGVPSEVIIPYFDSVYYNRFNEAKEKGENFFATNLSFEEKNRFYKKLFEYVPGLREEAKEFYFNCPGLAASTVLLDNVCLYIENFSGTPYTDEENNTLMRFGKVFQQTYTRFLDLQKSEAQAREAQIEAALERVRAKVMAMTNSKELNETSLVFGEQLRKLNIDWQFSYFWLVDESKNENTFWITWPDYKTSLTSYTLAEAEEYFNECLVSWRAGVKIHDNNVPPEGVQAWLDTFQRIADDAGGVAKEIMVFNTFANGVYYYDAMMKYGSFGICINKPATNEEKNIQCRFAVEFERAYTRFLDLKKAEAQAREARIEAALEKVRASTMAMQKSDDLSTAAYVLFQQFKELGEQAERIFIATIDDDERWVDLWGTNQGGNQLNKLFKVSIDEPTVISKIALAWKAKEKSIVIELTGDELNKYVSFLKSTGIPVTEGVMSDRRVQTIACFSKGVIGVTTPEPQPEESIQLLERFAGVFDLTYTRFLDLTVAETKAHEARIEVALERVRARALAMQQPEELKDVAQVLRNEMGLLGVEELETSSIYIHPDNSEQVECWYALKDPVVTDTRMVSDHFELNLNDTWVGREMQKFYISNDKQTSIVMRGANRKEWIEYCYKLSPVFTGFYGETIPDRTYHLYKFSHGYIGAAAPAEISSESWRLLSRAASVFSLAYSRFKDLSQARIDLIKLKEEKKRAEDALTELQATQKQLIQAEKMASLGELTAGIAHEIQNPLNFVNNFSDVSNELLEEMKAELEKGNAEEAKAIAVDVKENLGKILHHGKRADAIVKGMLQHSRASSGQKELTDINVLAEEYLRLAYHGLRAKDKFFNAAFETDLDPSINKINVVPQEIGRVILNLINNSFYAVNEKKKVLNNGYEPTVIVSTKKINDKIEIRVKDNGNGIPQKVLDKIFQPFFTTKPTGEGTGLGLSLSYDIITKGHDGEIKVETKEGEGSAFIISLPEK